MKKIFFYIFLVISPVWLHAQSYYNKVLDYNAEAMGSASGNIELVEDHLYSAGHRATANGIEVVLSKWDLEGNLIEEASMQTGSDIFYLKRATNLHHYDNKFFFCSNGLNDEPCGIYCFTTQMDSLWAQSFPSLEGHQISGPIESKIHQDTLYISGFESTDISIWFFMARFDLEGEFIDLLRQPASTGTSGQRVDDILFDQNQLFVSGNTYFYGAETFDGFVSELNTTSGEIVEQTINGNPVHYDSRIEIEPFDDQYLLGVQLITDSIYSGGVQPNEDFWFNHIETFLIDKTDLSISNITNHGSLDLGRLFFAKNHETGLGILGNDNPDLVPTISSWFHKLSPQGETDFHVDFNYLTCDGGCIHNLWDFELDDFGNFYGIGTVFLNNDEYQGNYQWMVAFDCHGRTSQPNLDIQIDALLTQSGDYLFQPTNEIMDDYMWFVDDVLWEGENTLINLLPGIHNIRLETSYCGSQFTNTIEVDVPNSILEKAQEKNLKIFPNPSDHLVYFQFGGSSTIDLVSIYSMEGKLLNQFENWSTTKGFNIQNLEPGTYTVMCQVGPQSFSQRLIVE